MSGVVITTRSQFQLDGNPMSNPSPTHEESLRYRRYKPEITVYQQPGCPGPVLTPGGDGSVGILGGTSCNVILHPLLHSHRSQSLDGLLLPIGNNERQSSVLEIVVFSSCLLLMRSPAPSSPRSCDRGPKLHELKQWLAVPAATAVVAARYRHRYRYRS